MSHLGRAVIARRPIHAILCAAVPLLALTACGAQSSDSPAVVRPSISVLAQRYAEIDDTARLKALTILAELKLKTTLQERRVTIAGLATTFRTFDGELTSLDFPVAMSGDLRNLNNADSQIAAIADNLSHAATVADFGDLFGTLAPVMAQQTAADNAVRLSLGLPQASQTTAR